jgi:hypothetical protein
MNLTDWKFGISQSIQRSYDAVVAKKFYKYDTWSFLRIGYDGLQIYNASGCSSDMLKDVDLREGTYSKYLKVVGVDEI